MPWLAGVLSMSLVATINEPFDPDLDRVASDLLRAAGDAAQAAAALDDAGSRSASSPA